MTDKPIDLFGTNGGIAPARFKETTAEKKQKLKDKRLQEIAVYAGLNFSQQQTAELIGVSYNYFMKVYNKWYRQHRGAVFVESLKCISNRVIKHGDVRAAESCIKLGMAIMKLQSDKDAIEQAAAETEKTKVYDVNDLPFMEDPNNPDGPGIPNPNFDPTKHLN